MSEHNGIDTFRCPNCGSVTQAVLIHRGVVSFTYIHNIRRDGSYDVEDVLIDPVGHQGVFVCRRCSSVIAKDAKELWEIAKQNTV